MCSRDWLSPQSCLLLQTWWDLKWRRHSWDRHLDERRPVGVKGLLQRRSQLIRLSPDAFSSEGFCDLHEIWIMEIRPYESAVIACALIVVRRPKGAIGKYDCHDIDAVVDGGGQVR
jgi:hypothetical protein